MKRHSWPGCVFCLAAALALAAALPPLHGQAQTVTPAVPVTNEPHHHLAYSNSNVRAFQVEVPPHSSTLLHRHDVDYIWLALGDADVVNAVAEQPEARIKVSDGSVHYTRGGFAHVARNDTDSPFRNVTIEILQTQTNAQNICGEVLPGAPLGCRGADIDSARKYKGTTVRPEFSTDQMRVLTLQLAPGAKFTVSKSKTPPVLVAFDGTEAQALVSVPVAGGATGKGTRELHSGDILGCPPDFAVEIQNTGKFAARFLALEFKNGKI
jgi:hypothetical protein